MNRKPMTIDNTTTTNNTGIKTSKQLTYLAPRFRNDGPSIVLETAVCIAKKTLLKYQKPALVITNMMH